MLRDGAAAQYGSDAIAGVVNLVLKDGAFTPFLNGDAGRYVTDDYPDDGTTVNVNGGWGIRLGRGSLGIFGEFRDRQPTNRAWADPFEVAGTGVADSINDIGQVIHKNNPVPQPNHHWGDGLEKDALALGNFRMPVNEAGSSEIYAFGGYSHRDGIGNPYRRYAGSARNWDADLSARLPAEHRGPGHRLLDGRRAARASSRAGTTTSAPTFGHNDFDYEIGNTLNASLGPCLDVACAPGADGVLGTADDPGIPEPAVVLRRAGAARGVVTALNIAKPVELGLPEAGQPGVRRGVPAGALRDPRRASWRRTSTAARRIRPARRDLAPGGSQSFPGFAPGDETDRHRNNFGLYADAETNLSEKVLADVARAVRELQRLRLAGERQGIGALPAVAAGHAPRRGEHRLPRAGSEPGGVQQGGDQRDRGAVHGRRHLPGRQPGRAGAGRQAARGRDVVQPERRLRGDAGGQLHAHRRLLPHPDQQPDPARRHVRRRTRR